MYISQEAAHAAVEQLHTVPTSLGMKQSSGFQSSSVLLFAVRRKKAKGWQAELEKSSAEMAGERMVERAGKKARQMEERVRAHLHF